MHVRTANNRTPAEALAELSDVLNRLGIEATNEAGRADLFVCMGGRRLGIEVAVAAAPTPGAVRELVSRARPKLRSASVPVLVADRLSEAARAHLRDAEWSWLDRRGHLRLWAPSRGVLVETDVEPLVVKNELSTDPLSSQVGLEVASALLLDPEADVSVRGLARSLERAPSAVSMALARFRSASLLTAGSKPLVPELFEEVSARWTPRRTALARAPMPGDAGALERMEFNFGDRQAPGWALTDTLAAYHYGAPIVVGSGYPPDFYVPSPRILREAANHFGLAASYETRACTVSVPPVAAAVTDRQDRSPVVADERLLTRPLFVALELARDRSRGREILAGWTPPEGFIRVW